MADYISREAAINNLYKLLCKVDEDGYRWVLSRDVAHMIDEIPAADVRPVVLCRDCRWWTKQEKSLQGRCELGGFYPTGEWFCANGERSNCGADMRKPNLDTTKGDNHD